MNEVSYDELILCYRCKKWVPVDRTIEETECSHEFEVAGDDSHLSGKETAFIIHDACKQYLESHSENARYSKPMKHQLMSVTFDFVMNDDLPEDYEFLSDELYEES